MVSVKSAGLKEKVPYVSVNVFDVNKISKIKLDYMISFIFAFGDNLL